MVHVEKDEDEEEGVDILTLVGEGRVATQTRKAWMLAGQVDGQVRVFSIGMRRWPIRTVVTAYEAGTAALPCCLAILGRGSECRGLFTE